MKYTECPGAKPPASTVEPALSELADGQKYSNNTKDVLKVPNILASLPQGVNVLFKNTIILKKNYLQVLQLLI